MNSVKTAFEYFRSASPKERRHRVARTIAGLGMAGSAAISFMAVDEYTHLPTSEACLPLEDGLAVSQFDRQDEVKPNAVYQIVQHNSDVLEPACPAPVVPSGMETLGITATGFLAFAAGNYVLKHIPGSSPRVESVSTEPKEEFVSATVPANVGMALQTPDGAFILTEVPLPFEDRGL